MPRGNLGRSGLDITPVGFGACAIGGGGWSFGWGHQDDKQSIATIRRAVELGRIDTAPVGGPALTRGLKGGPGGVDLD